MLTESDAATEFDCLLNWLGPRPEEAGRRYESLRQKLSEFFERQGCAPAAEWADKTFDIVGRKLAAGETIRAEAPATYCLGVARMLRMEYWRNPERKFDPLASAAEFKANDPQEALAKEWRHACLAACLNNLPAADADL